MTNMKLLKSNYACVLLLASLVSVLPLSEGQAKNVPTTRTAVRETSSAPLTLGGRLVCNLDRKYIVKTQFGDVTCAPKVTAYVFDNERSIAVYNFDSTRKDDVTLVFNNRQIAVRPAEQLVISRVSQASFNEINPGLGIIHKKPQLIDVGNGFTGYLAEFSLVSGIGKLPILSRMTTSNKPNEKQAIERILKNAAILQSSAERILRRRAVPTGTVAQMLETGKKLAGDSPVLKGMVERFSHGQQQHVDMRVAECRNRGYSRAAGLTWVELIDSDWKAKGPKSDGRYEVASVLTCPVDTLVKTELGEIACKKGSIVFVVNCENSVSICTLDSPHLDDVTVRVGTSPALRLAAGRQIVLTKDLEEKFEKLNPAHLIGYRDEKEVGNVNGIKIMRADFSLTSAMMTLEPLRHMVASQDSEQKRIAESILKNSAILWGLTSSQGVFHPTK